jgi:hypothetical protein
LWANSQPFASALSQLLKPPLQAAIWQEPVAHVAVALSRAQALPHEPQLVRVWSCV